MVLRTALQGPFGGRDTPVCINHRLSGASSVCLLIPVIAFKIISANHIKQRMKSQRHVRRTSLSFIA